MKILIAGDSFAADWTVKYPDGKGWPNLLAEHHDVTNLAQAGIGEYKVYTQLKSVLDFESYDLILIAHASPWRIPTIANPMHANDPLLANSDLIFSDLEYHSNKFANLFNRPMQSAVGFYQYHYDENFFKLCYDLIRKKIDDNLSGKNFLILNFRSATYAPNSLVLNLHDIVVAHKGCVNHLSNEGNYKVFTKIMEKIDESFQDNS